MKILGAPVSHRGPTGQLSRPLQAHAPARRALLSPVGGSPPRLHPYHSNPTLCRNLSPGERCPNMKSTHTRAAGVHRGGQRSPADLAEFTLFRRCGHQPARLGANARLQRSKCDLREDHHHCQRGQPVEKRWLQRHPTWQAISNNAAGRPIFIPAGEYTFHSTDNLKTDTILFGIGSAFTILRPKVDFADNTPPLAISQRSCRHNHAGRPQAASADEHHGRRHHRQGGTSQVAAGAASTV